MLKIRGGDQPEQIFQEVMIGFIRLRVSVQSQQNKINIIRSSCGLFNKAGYSAFRFCHASGAKNSVHGTNSGNCFFTFPLAQYKKSNAFSGQASLVPVFQQPEVIQRLLFPEAQTVSNGIRVVCQFIQTTDQDTAGRSLMQQHQAVEQCALKRETPVNVSVVITVESALLDGL